MAVRILLFYVFAIGVILLISPWHSITGEQSPFMQVFDGPRGGGDIATGRHRLPRG